jgi:hypothetical protein
MRALRANTGADHDHTHHNHHDSCSSIRGEHDLPCHHATPSVTATPAPVARHLWRGDDGGRPSPPRID